MRHLNRLEQRLEEAAREVRQAARRATPPALEEKGGRLPRGWLVFATAFATVLVAVGLIPALTRSGAPDTTTSATSPATTVPAVTSTLPAETTTSGAPEANCSAAGLAMPPDQEGLPEPVAAMRRAISEAAIACDFAALEELAGPDLVTSFGGGGFENITLWEEQGEGQLGTLVRLFDTPFGSEDYEDLPRHYYWPSAFVYDTWEEIPPADVDALRTIYTDEELREIAAFGSYAGWRIGITEDGDWRFFVAGD